MKQNRVGGETRVAYVGLTQESCTVIVIVISSTSSSFSISIVSRPGCFRFPEFVITYNALLHRVGYLST